MCNNINQQIMEFVSQNLLKEDHLRKQLKSTIYIRNYAKKAIMLTLPPQARLSIIKQKIQKRMKIPAQDQALFLFGRLLSNEQQQLEVHNKMILHLINLRRINLPRISISIKRIEPNSPLHKFTVSPNMRIGDFVYTSFAQQFQNVHNYFFVHTARELQLVNTFAAEFVEDESEILAVHKVENLYGHRIDQGVDSEGEMSRDVQNELIQKNVLIIKRGAEAGEGQVKVKDQIEELSDENLYKKYFSSKQENDENYESDNIYDRYIKDNENNRAEQKKSDRDEDDEIENIVINNFTSYSVISKNNPMAENQHMKKPIGPQAAQAGALGLHQSLQSNSPLILTIISSRHEEEDSQLYDSIHKYTHSSGNKLQKIEQQLIVQQQSYELQKENNGFIESVTENEQQVEENIMRQSSDLVQLKEGIDENIDEGKYRAAEHQEDEGIYNQQAEKQEQSMGEKSKHREGIQQNRENAGLREKSQYQECEQKLLLEDSISAENGHSTSVNSLQVKDQRVPEPALIQVPYQNAKANCKSETDSLLLQNSQDNNEQNMISGRFKWMESKDEKNIIDMSAQLQDEVNNFNEIIQGNNVNNWHKLSFSFQNNQSLELRMGDMVLLADEQCLKSGGIYNQVIAQFQEVLLMAVDDNQI